MRTPFARFLRCIAASCVAASAVGAWAASAQIHDQVVVAPVPIDGLVPRELSGLAWDADEQLLYAVSDRGQVFHFKLRLDGTRFELTPVYAAPLLPQNGSKRLNAEGLAVIDADNGKRGDTQLVVALENGPSLMRYTPQGRALGEVPLPAALRDPTAYRGGNRLESVSVHPKHGYVTAPQSPLKSQPSDMHRLYASDGNEWTVPASERGAVKAIETLPDGSLLVLERQGRGKAVTPVLRRIDPAACAATRANCAAGAAVSLPGLDPGDNFEGLARLSPRLFIMVSDDGGNGQRPTRMVLFGLDGP